MRKTGVLLFGLIGAIVLSQFPEFFQQYVQRLGGRLDEVTNQVTSLDKRAAEAGTSTSLYLRDFILNRDPQVRREGQELQALVRRRVVLAADYRALNGSGSWWRAAHFVEHFDWDIAATTFQAFQPAMPVTAESAVYTGAGFGTGMVIFVLIFGWRRRRPRHARH